MKRQNCAVSGAVLAITAGIVALAWPSASMAQDVGSSGSLALDASVIDSRVLVQADAWFEPNATNERLWVRNIRGTDECPADSAGLSGAPGAWLTGGGDGGEVISADYSKDWEFSVPHVRRDLGYWHVCGVIAWNGQQTSRETGQTLITGFTASNASYYPIPIPCRGVVQGFIRSEFVRLRGIEVAGASCSYAQREARRIFRNYRRAKSGPERVDSCTPDGGCTYVYGPVQLPGGRESLVWWERYGFDIGRFQIRAAHDTKTAPWVQIGDYHEPEDVYRISCAGRLSSRTCS